MTKPQAEWQLFNQPPTLERQYAISTDDKQNTFVLRLGRDPFTKKPRLIKGGNLVKVSKDGTTSLGRKAGRHYNYIIGTMIDDYFKQNKELDHFNPSVHTLSNLLRGRNIQQPYRALKVQEPDSLELAQNQEMKARHALHLPHTYSLITHFRDQHKHSWIIEADKKCLLIGQIGMISYKEIFPEIKSNKL